MVYQGLSECYQWIIRVLSVGYHRVISRLSLGYQWVISGLSECYQWVITDNLSVVYQGLSTVETCHGDPLFSKLVPDGARSLK